MQFKTVRQLASIVNNNSNSEERRKAMFELVTGVCRDICPIQPVGQVIVRSALVNYLLDLAYSMDPEKQGFESDKIMISLALVLETNLENRLGICSEPNDFEYGKRGKGYVRYASRVPTAYNSSLQELEFDAA